MDSQFLVMVVDADDPRRVEISAAGNAAHAARLVETLLEAGFDQVRIRVFEGVELEMQVVHKPVVSLFTNDEPEQQTAPHEPEMSTALEETQEEQPTPAEEESVPFVQNGVRFSSLFKSS